MTALAIHADWSILPAKRWMATATHDGKTWHVEAPEPVGPLETLLDRIQAKARGTPVAFGVDLPLGLPRAFAARRPEPDFPAFLRALSPNAPFFDVCQTLEQLSDERPFYPARGTRGMTRLSHASALGFADASALSRLCDRATTERPAGAPLFWTLGANQTGKAAITGWRDLLIPALRANAPIRLWPFEGDFASLLAPGIITIAETYPAEALRHLGLRVPGSKRSQTDRQAMATALLATLLRLHIEPSPALATLIREGFGNDAAGEDRLDCVLGVLCVIGVLDGVRPAGIPDDPWLRRWEGWVLGQTSGPREYPIAGYAPP